MWCLFSLPEHYEISLIKKAVEYFALVFSEYTDKHKWCLLWCWWRSKDKVTRMSVWVFQERKRRKRGRFVDVITEDMQRDDVTEEVLGIGWDILLALCPFLPYSRSLPVVSAAPLFAFVGINFREKPNRCVHLHLQVNLVERERTPPHRKLYVWTSISLTLMPLLKSQGLSFPLLYFYLDLNSFAASNRVTKERRSFKYNYNNLSENKLGRLFWSLIVIFTAAVLKNTRRAPELPKERHNQLLVTVKRVRCTRKARTWS